jgi:hypothetical protein
MAQRSPKRLARSARVRIARMRGALAAIDYLCSGTRLEGIKVCGEPTCRCETDPAARHSPYFNGAICVRENSSTARSRPSSPH